MSDITTIALDLAKNIFQVHAVDATGAVVVRRQLRRREVLRYFERLPHCLIGIEACATAHNWGRELRAMGHEVRGYPINCVSGHDVTSDETGESAAYQNILDLLSWICADTRWFAVTTSRVTQTINERPVV